MFFPVLLSAQTTFRLSGKITEAESQQALSEVNIFEVNSGKGTSTDVNGNFELFLKKGDYQLIITYLGYKDFTESGEIVANKNLQISMQSASQDLEEVLIRQNVDKKKISSTQMSVNTLTAKKIKELPSVLGEKDIIKSILLLPGVSNSGEGSGGFNVRGGAADQNLVLLDKVTLFNDSHLFGFFSVFNPDAVQKLDLYKGGIPAEYGNRTSSVLAIQQKTGHLDSLQIEGGIGVVSSRITAQGPIEKNKSSYLVSGRSSYAHLFLKLADNPNSGYFYDVNTKLNFLLDEKNSLEFSGYFGRDVFNLNESFKNTYGNAVLAGNWEHIFSENLQSDLQLSLTDFYFGLTLDFVGFNWDSGIRKWDLDYSFEHSLSTSVKLDYGLITSHYSFNPGYLEPSRENSGISKKQLVKKYAWQNAAFLSASVKLSEKLRVNAGLRLNNFNRLGQTQINNYANDMPVAFNSNLEIYEKAPVTSTYSSDKWTIEKSFFNIEPRLAIAYEIDENNSVKASYHRLHQYLHLISNANAPTPLDVWAPSGRYIQPQQADQIALGYFTFLEKWGILLETEVFYKEVANRIDYINGAQLIANEAIEQVILNGKQRAYGLEFLAKKSVGKLTGWLSYTLSKSEQKTPGRTPEEPGINNGNWYNTAWDRTHDISVTAQYPINKKWRLSSNFIFQTGRAATYPNSKYVYDNLIVPNYSFRNANRLPAYHRLDLSATYTPKPDKNNGWQAEWVFGIYNIYNRKNAASINFGKNEDSGLPEATRLSIFGIIPSVTYNFKF